MLKLLYPLGWFIQVVLLSWPVVLSLIVLAFALDGCEWTKARRVKR